MFNTSLLFSTGIYSMSIHLLLDVFLIQRTGIIMSFLLVYASLFLMLQYSEFSSNLFVLNANLHNGVFYLVTGLHGSHLLFGMLFILITFRNVSSFITILSNGIKFAILY